MSVPPVPCPNCGTPWPSGATVCPNCGFIRPAVPAWPPPPVGVAAPYGVPPPVPKLVTGKAWGDITLGIGLSFLSNFLACTGFLVMPILYFTLRPNYPTFARGLGYGTLAGLVLLLGAFVYCMAGLGNWSNL